MTNDHYWIATGPGEPWVPARPTDGGRWYVIGTEWPVHAWATGPRIRLPTFNPSPRHEEDS